MLDNPIIGGCLGLLAGIVIDIFFGGLIATILIIDENLDRLISRMTSMNVSDLSPVSPVGKIKEEKKCKKCGKFIDSDYPKCPHCGSSDFI